MWKLTDSWLECPEIFLSHGWTLRPIRSRMCSTRASSPDSKCDLRVNVVDSPSGKSCVNGLYLYIGHLLCLWAVYYICTCSCAGVGRQSGSPVSRKSCSLQVEGKAPAKRDIVAATLWPYDVASRWQNVATLLRAARTQEMFLKIFWNIFCVHHKCCGCGKTRKHLGNMIT